MRKGQGSEGSEGGQMSGEVGWDCRVGRDIRRLGSQKGRTECGDEE